MNPFTDIQLIETEQKDVSVNGRFNSLLIGAGDNAFRVDRQGIWLGANNFEDADFSVDMNGTVNLIDGIITGGTIQTATSGARIVINGNDIILYDDSTGGTSPITGNTASLLFTRTDEKNGDFLIQKRSSKNDDNGNVLEMFFNEIPSSDYNYLFIGRKGDQANTPSEWKTDVISMGATGIMQINIADRIDSVATSSFGLITGSYWNTMEGITSLMKPDALQVQIVGAKGISGSNPEIGNMIFGMKPSRNSESSTSKILLALDYDNGTYVQNLIFSSIAGGTPSITLNSETITSWNDVRTSFTNISSNVVPSFNLTYDLGNSSYSWDEIFVRTLSNGGNIYMSLGGIDTSYVSFFKSIDLNGHNIINIGNLDVNGDIDCEGSCDINSFLSVHDKLYMNNTQIKDLATPSSGNDGANKQYVDNRETAIKSWVTANFTPL